MLIGIAGKIGSGKDTVGEIIQRNIPGSEIKKFASPIKQIAGIILGEDPRKFEDRIYRTAPLGPQWGFLTPRKILQLLGTEAGRDIIHPDIWINATFANWNQDTDWIITDVRFPNEAESIKKRGGVVVHVKRDVETPKKYAEHSSETSLDGYTKWDYVIDNSGTFDELEKKVKELLEKLFKI